MAQRNSEYKRLPMDLYQTPAWVTETLIPHIPRRVTHIWEPAAGKRAMVKVLVAAGYHVFSTDIKTGQDFLKITKGASECVITNPPYTHAQKFIEKALEITQKPNGFVAILTRIDFDSAKTRQHLFADHPAFSKKIVLLKRIRWIKNSTGSPSENHCWLIWDWRHKGSPTIAYEPRERS